MGPTAAIRLSLRASFRFSGHAARSEFWWSWTILYFVAMAIAAIRGSAVTHGRGDAFLTLALCAVALPMIAVGTRRLADAGVWRWFFVLTVAVGTADQALRYATLPTASDIFALSFAAERSDVRLPLSWYEAHHLIRVVRNDILPWTGMILAVLCLVLAALPSRQAARPAASDVPEVTP